MTRRSIAWTLSKAAKILPPAERQQFREFLRSLPGGKPARRKRHSWKRKKHKAAPRAKPVRTDPQQQLPLD